MRQIAQLAGPSLHTVVINADSIGIPDVTARDALITAQSALEKRGIRLVFGNVRAAQREPLARGGFTIIEESQFLATIREIRARESTRHPSGVV